MSENKTVLRYIGNGAFFPGVPARDLTAQDFIERADEWEHAGWTETSLISTGLYAYPVETPEKPKGKSKGATFE